MAKGKTEARLKGKEKDNSQLPCQQETRDPISMSPKRGRNPNHVVAVVPVTAKPFHRAQREPERRLSKEECSFGPRPEAGICEERAV